MTSKCGKNKKVAHEAIAIIIGSANHPLLAVLETELQKGAAHDIGLKAYKGTSSCRYTVHV